ncbi:MAG: TolC family protein, partial [Pseudomonadota bacterium]
MLIRRFRVTGLLRKVSMAVLAVCLSCWCASLSWAAEDKAKVFTLKECLDQALEKSLSLANADKTIEGAQWQKKSAFTNFLPSVKAQYLYTRLDEQPEVRTALGQVITKLPAIISGQTLKAGSQDNFELTLTVSQTVFTGFALLTQYRLAEMGLDAAEIAKDRTKLDLILKVKEAYFAILQAEKSLEVAEQSVKQLEAHLKRATSFFDVGMVPKNDVLQAEVRLAEAIQNRTTASHLVLFNHAALNTLLHLDMDALIEIQDILAYKPFTTSLEQCLDQALSLRPEVKAAGKLIDVNQQQVRLAQADYYPTVAVQYNQSKKGDTWLVNGSDYVDEYSWNVVAVASWKLWEWGRTRDGVQVTRTELAKAKNTLTEVKDGVRLEVKGSYLALQASEKNIQVAKKAVEQAEENYRMSSERYREQVATATEVMDAETLLTSARTRYYN